MPASPRTSHRRRKNTTAETLDGVVAAVVAEPVRTSHCRRATVVMLAASRRRRDRRRKRRRNRRRIRRRGDFAEISAQNAKAGNCWCRKKLKRAIFQKEKNRNAGREGAKVLLQNGGQRPQTKPNEKQNSGKRSGGAEKQKSKATPPHAARRGRKFPRPLSTKAGPS